MTAEVIDARHRRWLAEFMRDPRASGSLRFDRMLRAVMWLDAFLSVALVVVCVITTPIIATVGVPPSIRFALGLAAMVCAALLASLGAITAALIMSRMRDGQYLLPLDLRLPLPSSMRPTPASVADGDQEA